MQKGEKSVKVELELLKIMGLQHDFIIAIQNGDKAAGDAIIQQVADMGVLLGITDATAQTTGDMAGHWQAAVVDLNAAAEKARDIYDVIKDINKEFGDFPGKKLAERLGDIRQRSIKMQEGVDWGLESSKDQDAKDAINEELLFLNQQGIFLEKRIEAETKLLELKVEQREASFESFLEQDSVTQKQIDSKLASAKIDQASNQADIFAKKQAITIVERDLKLSQEAADRNEESASEMLIANREALRLAEERLAIAKQMGVAIATEIAVLDDTDPWKKPPKPTKTKTPKVSVEKIRGYEQQTILEHLKAEESIRKAIIKNELNSFAQKREAAEYLLNNEVKLHTQRLRVIRANMADAEATHDKAAAIGDAAGMAKAELEYAKGIGAYTREVVDEYQKLYDLQKQLHELKKKQTQEGMPTMENFGELLKDDLIYAADKILKAMTDPITMLTEAIVSSIDQATNSLADAIVEGDASKLKEDMANNLKSSSKKFLSSGFKSIIYGLFPKAEMHGQAVDELSALNEQSKLLAEIRDAVKDTNMIGSVTGGAEDVVENAMSSVFSKIFGFMKTSIMSIFGYANGGIIQHAYSSGGIVSRPEVALIGEGKNNEAVVPLPDNKSIPVKLSGNSGAVNSNVYVSIASDGSTSTSTESDAQEAKRLGELINKSVQRIIVNERRVGGLLGA